MKRSCLSPSSPGVGGAEGREKRAGVSAVALLGQETAEVGGGPQLQPEAPRGARFVEGGAQPHLGLPPELGRRGRAFSGQQQRCAEAEQIGFAQPLALSARESPWRPKSRA